MITINEDFAKLIPPLTEDEYAGLEASIVSEGCRDALILWGDVLIDGHNRYRICTEHNIPYETRQMEFENRDDVLLWIMRNQLSRRNLNDFQRIELVRRYEDAVKAQAEQRMLSGKADPVVSGKIAGNNCSFLDVRRTIVFVYEKESYCMSFNTIFIERGIMVLFINLRKR